MEATLFALAVACGVLLVKAAARAVLRRGRGGGPRRKNKSQKTKTATDWGRWAENLTALRPFLDIETAPMLQCTGKKQGGGKADG